MGKMEVPQAEVTSEKWREMVAIAEDNVCATCGGELTVHTNAESATLEVGCTGEGHHGWVQRSTAVQQWRRGESGGADAVAAVDRNLLQSLDINRAMNLLSVRYPKAIVDFPTAALFIMDCTRLGLDPLIAPAEAVPIPFRSRGRGGDKVTIQMIITIDGWLSMAARACPERWAGAPSVEPVFDERMAESLCKDPKAWLYKATGATLSPQGTVLSTFCYGWFTQAEYKQSTANHTPAHDNPGNQAMVRAIKRWVRMNFPECRQKMMDITKEWRNRARGIKEAEEYVDGEYSVLDEKAGTHKALPAPRERGVKKGRKPSENSGAKREAGGGAGEAAATNFPEEQENTQKNRERRPGAGPAGGNKTGGGRDPATVTTIQELYQACHEDWGMYPSQVNQELNVNSGTDIAELPRNCYIRIKAVMCTDN